MNKLIIILLVSQLSIFTNSYAQKNSQTEITYIGNEGFIIVNNFKKVLIDALYNNTANNGIVNIDDSLSNLIITNQRPFANCDLYLVTHANSDHYDKTMVSAYLENNPQALLVADSTIIEPLKSTFGDQLFSATPQKYNSIDTTLNGIQISVYNLMHNSAVKIYNVGFWANINGLRIFHGGDNFLEDTTEYLNTNLFSKQVDVAFLNHNGFLKSMVNSDFIVKHMKPSYIVLMHIPPSQLLSVQEKVYKLDSSYPQVIVCDTSMKKIIFNNSSNVSDRKSQNSWVYPNPATNQIFINNIHFPKIQIIDLTGNLIADKKVTTNPIDISGLKKGIYFIKLSYTKEVTIQKIMKE